MNETLKTAQAHLDTCADSLRKFRSVTDGGISAEPTMADDFEAYSTEATKLLVRLIKMQESIRRAVLATK